MGVIRFLYSALLFVFLSAFVLSPGYAQNTESSRDQEVDERFKKADTNHDGKLTLAEAQEGMPRVARHFSQIDTQNKGYITVTEIKALADR